MLLQGFNPWDIVFILIATIFLWLMLWLATRLIVNKTFASDKKFMLLLVALLTIVLIPLLVGVIMYLLGFVGEAVVWLRNLVDPNDGGQNYVTELGAIFGFLLFYFLLHFMVRMDWRDTLWVSLIGLFLLYLLYSLVPEIYFNPLPF